MVAYQRVPANVSASRRMQVASIGMLEVVLWLSPAVATAWISPCQKRGGKSLAVCPVTESGS